MDGSDAELDRLWTDFYALVNMSRHELRAFLVAEPDGAVPEFARRLLHTMDVARPDLTADNVETMERAVGEIRRLLADRPDGDDPAWRDALMRVGHDPAKPAAPGAYGARP
jgi:hypothetical protein